jgi:hypothetical protein
MPPKTRVPSESLRLYWLIFNVALETDVKHLLASFKLQAYSHWDEVQGSGRSGPHLNDEVWPVVNALYVFAAPASLETKLAKAVADIRSQFPGEGIKLIVQPCSAVH